MAVWVVQKVVVVGRGKDMHLEESCEHWWALREGFCI